MSFQTLLDHYIQMYYRQLEKQKEIVTDVEKILAPLTELLVCMAFRDVCS